MVAARGGRPRCTDTAAMVAALADCSGVSDTSLPAAAKVQRAGASSDDTHRAPSTAAQAVSSAVVPAWSASEGADDQAEPCDLADPGDLAEPGHLADPGDSAAQGSVDQAMQIVENLLARTPDAELLTMLVRPDATGLADAVRAHLAAAHPDVEVQTLSVAVDSQAPLTLGVE